MGDDYEDDDRFTDDDRALMRQHDIEEDEYELLYQRVLEHVKDYGTLAMDAIQKRVIADIEAGMRD